MRARLHSLAMLLLAFSCGCNVGHEVGQDGVYAFLPGANVDDLAPYPLERLLIVEDDAETSRAYVYLFAGELREASLGLQDLRRIALQYGQYQMAFDPPRARYAEEPLEGSGKPLALELDGGDDVELLKLDDAGLAQSGAGRWLSTVTSGDFHVRAYFGVIERDGELEGFTIEDPGTDTELTFEPALPELQIEVAIGDDALMVDYGEAKQADSLTFDLWQQITTKAEPHTTVEAEVRTLLPPGGQYGAGASLITDAAGKGCWSDEKPLGVRVMQLRRAYDAQDGGSALVHVKLDTIWIPPENWTVLLGDPTPAAYCKDYE